MILPLFDKPVPPPVITTTIPFTEKRSLVLTSSILIDNVAKPNDFLMGF